MATDGGQNVTECFSDKSSWCRNEYVCQGVKCFEVSNGLDALLYNRLQNVNGGQSGTLAFYFCPFWGACLQVTRACRQLFVVDIYIIKFY